MQWALKKIKQGTLRSFLSFGVTTELWKELYTLGELERGLWKYSLRARNSATLLKQKYVIMS